MTPPPPRPPHGSRRTGSLLAASVLVAVAIAASVASDAPRPDIDADRQTDAGPSPPEQADAVNVVVDQAHTAASDDNPGTPDRPVATLGRATALAIDYAAEGRHVVVRVRAGVYREAVEIDGSEARAPIVMEGAGADETVVDGSDVWTDWSPLDDSVLEGHPWPYDWGVADLPSEGWEGYFDRNEVSDIARRREAVWIDGMILRQVLEQEDAEDTPATFFVDEDAGLLLVHPPEGINMADATVEVAVRDRLLDVVNVHGFTLRNIGFQRAATPLQQAAVRVISSRSVMLEGVRSAWNSWGGLALQRSEDLTIRDTSLDHNGVMGLSVWRTSDLRLTDVNNSYNNTWRGRWAGYLGWANGSKFYSVRDVRIEGWTAVGNDANGLWLDTDVADVTIRDSYIAGNLRRGIFLEALQGPVVITGTVVCGNADGGVVDGKSTDVTLEGNRLVGNGVAQLAFSGSRGGRSFETYDTAEELTVQSERWTMRGNLFGATGSTALVRTTLDVAEWELLMASLTAQENVWHHPTDAQPFAVPGRGVGFSAWREVTEEQGSSRFIPEAAPGVCVPPRAAPDG